jgi:branched-subunit amino acid ABC-type transport system permease component
MADPTMGLEVRALVFMVVIIGGLGSILIKPTGLCGSALLKR